MLNFYKKIFRIFCRITDNPAAEGGNHPENMAFFGTTLLCIFNLLTVFLLIKMFIFQKSWEASDNIVLGIIGGGISIYFHFLFTHNDNHRKYIDLNKDLDKATKKRENWFLGLYIIISLLLFVAAPILSSQMKDGS